VLAHALSASTKGTILRFSVTKQLGQFKPPLCQIRDSKGISQIHTGNQFFQLVDPVAHDLTSWREG
jgi:hypothetical protein